MNMSRIADHIYPVHLRIKATKQPLPAQALADYKTDQVRHRAVEITNSSYPSFLFTKYATFIFINKYKTCNWYVIIKKYVDNEVKLN